ncbi:MAG TPA: hypothetical protein VMB05_14690 [Solirubrobacteraceae bacterium]|nr:hypothetical protein [Solirubrobacteraceae bacterium]
MAAMAMSMTALASARRSMLVLLASLALTTAIVAGVESGKGIPAGSAGAGSSTKSIPANAQAEVSAALGAARKAFHVRPLASGEGLQASNPAQGMATSFTRSGVALAARGIDVHLSLQSLGWGSNAIREQRTTEVIPRGHSNRVTYAHSDGDGGTGLSEWYANGPAGLEQGFTIARAPASQPAGPAEPLTLTLALSANAQRKLAANGESLTLRRGSTLLHYGKLLSTDAKGRALHTWLELEGRRLLIHVDAAQAAYPLRIDPLIQAGGRLTANDELGEGLMGTSVALSGDGSTLLVGGPQDANPARGAAWVFVREGSSWVQQGSKLTGAEVSSEPGEEEQCAEESPEEVGECAFGNSVALSADGNTALVGEPSASTRHGNAWIFTRSGETWSKAAIMMGGPGSNEGRFGKSVALSADGTTALIGDPSASGQRGSAWVFVLGGSGWEVQQTLVESAPEHFDHLGRSVALSGDGATALIGAPGVGHYTGAALAFTRTSGIWQQQGQMLQGAEESGEGRFGRSVALSGDGTTALVGGLSNAENDGAVWPFARGSAGFEAQGAPLKGPEEAQGEADHYGFSVALSGDGTEGLVGIQRAPEGGAVAQLVRSGSQWSELGVQLVGSDRRGKGWMGASVALSSDGRVGAIGAPHDNARVGAAWIFVEAPLIPPPPPAVTNVVPGFGPAGTAVRVKGTNLSEAQQVFFGETPATSFKAKSGVTVEAVAPPGVVGTVDVTVKTPAGTSTVNSGDTFRYTTGKAKGGGSGNEEPGTGGGGGDPVGGGGQTSGGGQEGTQTSTTPGTKTGSQAPSGGVLGATSAAGAPCVLSLRSKRLAVTGYRTVALRLQRTGTSACSGKLTLSYNKSPRGKRAKLQTIGTASFAMGSASSKVLKIDLNKTGRKLFRRHGFKLNASLAFVRSLPAPKLARSASVRLSLKKTKKVTLAK